MKTLCLVAGLALVGCDGESSFCGDAELDFGEQCDDGNAAAGDGCSATCTTEPYCGDGIPNGTEQCDDGNTASGDGCSATCTTEPCGDGDLDAGEQCDDGNFRPSDGCSSTCTTELQYRVSATWTIKTFGGQVQSCPTGYDTATIVSQVTDAAGNDIGAPILDLFNCADGTGTTAPLYEGNYKFWIAIQNTNVTMTWGTSVPVAVSFRADLSFTAQLLTDGGYFAFVWNLIGASSNNTLSCAQVPNLDGIESLSTNVANSTFSYSDLFECVDGRGVTAGMPAGTYTVSISAFNTASQAVGTAAPKTATVMTQNQVTDLGTITIPITGL